jgi:hypothetical protein
MQHYSVHSTSYSVPRMEKESMPLSADWSRRLNQDLGDARTTEEVTTPYGVQIPVGTVLLTPPPPPPPPRTTQNGGSKGGLRIDNF